MLALFPPSPTCETGREGRVYFLLSSLCVLVHINIRTLYVFHALSTRGWTRRCLRPGGLWRSLVLRACYISSHVVMLPRISLTPSFLVKILRTLRRLLAGLLTILFVNTQALLMTLICSFVSGFFFLFYCHTQSCRSFVVCCATTDPFTVQFTMCNMLRRHIVRRLYSADFIPSQETSF